MLQVNWQAITLAAVASFALGTGIGWGVNGWRLAGELQRDKAAYATNLKTLSDAAEKQATELSAQRDAEMYRQNDIVSKYEADKQNAKTKSEEQRASITAGTTRLYVNANCPDVSGQLSKAGADSASAVAETRAELSPISRQAYSDLRESIINDQLQIDSLIAACGR